MSEDALLKEAMELFGDAEPDDTEPNNTETKTQEAPEGGGASAAQADLPPQLRNEKPSSQFVLMSLFSEEEIGPNPKEEQKKKREEEKRKKEEAKKQKEEKKRKREEELKKWREEQEKKNKPPDDLERIVCYARERRVFPAGTSLEDIRKEMSEEFWELTGDNVKMEWHVEENGDEKRLIVTPVITYARKGVSRCR
jgi:hypothetical protein